MAIRPLYLPKRVFVGAIINRPSETNILRAIDNRPYIASVLFSGGGDMRPSPTQI